MGENRGISLAGLALLVMAAGYLFFMGFFGAGNLIAVLSAVITIPLLAVFMGRIKDARLWLPVGTIAFLLLFAPAQYLVELPANTPERWTAPISYGLLFIMIASPVVSGLLLNAGMHRLPAAPAGGSLIKRIKTGWQDRSIRPGLVMIFVSLLLVLKSLVNFYSLLVWDGAGDSLKILWLFMPVIGILVGALALLVNMPVRFRYAGIVFTLLTPALFLAAFLLSQQVDNRELTDTRAARVSLAVERYHDRTGVYPLTLSQLSPLTTLTMRAPLILPGQEWCYQSDGLAYRLGYVNRDHWSSPYLSARVISEKGDGDFSKELCAEEIQALIALRPGYYSALK